MGQPAEHGADLRIKKRAYKAELRYTNKQHKDDNNDLFAAGRVKQDGATRATYMYTCTYTTRNYLFIARELTERRTKFPAPSSTCDQREMVDAQMRGAASRGGMHAGRLLCRRVEVYFIISERK